MGKIYRVKVTLEHAVFEYASRGEAVRELTKKVAYFRAVSEDLIKLTYNFNAFLLEKWADAIESMIEEIKNGATEVSRVDVMAEHIKFVPAKG